MLNSIERSCLWDMCLLLHYKAKCFILGHLHSFSSVSYLFKFQVQREKKKKQQFLLHSIATTVCRKCIMLFVLKIHCLKFSYIQHLRNMNESKTKLFLFGSVFCTYTISCLTAAYLKAMTLWIEKYAFAKCNHGVLCLSWIKNRFVIEK